MKSQRSSRSSTSTNVREDPLSIPVDLIIEILSRLPAKSIARCRCVSKSLTSTLLLPCFTELFFTKSLASPKLLFAYHRNNEMLFFSSSQPQNPDENSSLVAASYLMKIPLKFYLQIFSPINGLVCLRDERILKGRRKPETVSIICNPSTGQSFTLPKMKSRRRMELKSYFGYDPIERQFKVLSMTLTYGISHNENYEEYQVLTFGTKKLSWRMIECCMPHCPLYDHYYLIYFNIKKNTIARVEIQRIEFSGNGKFHTFLNHVETVKLMKALLEFSLALEFSQGVSWELDILIEPIIHPIVLLPLFFIFSLLIGYLDDYIFYG